MRERDLRPSRQPEAGSSPSSARSGAATYSLLFAVASWPLTVVAWLVGLDVASQPVAGPLTSPIPLVFVAVAQVVPVTAIALGLKAMNDQRSAGVPGDSSATVGVGLAVGCLVFALLWLAFATSDEGEPFPHEVGGVPAAAVARA